MTYDDGMLKIYDVVNTAEPGDMPVEGLVLKQEYYYHAEQIGISRYFAALEADQQVEAVVDVPDWSDIKTTDLAVLDGERNPKKISMVQTAYDENGLKITRLTLTKVDMNYDIPG